MLKQLNPWALVITGIVFNIASAVITHYFVGLNNERLQQLEQKAGQFDTLIESQWRTKIEMDRQQEFLMLLLQHSYGLQPTEQTAAQQHIRDRLNQALRQHQIPDLNLSHSDQLDLGRIDQISAAI